MSTNLALLQTNLNYMNKVCGMNYHWLSDLYKRLQIPILDGMEAVLKQVNERRIKEMEVGKTEVSKNSKLRSLGKHRGKEQVARSKWGHTQKLKHTYGKTKEFSDNSPHSSSVKAESQTTPSRQVRANKRACKCGSTLHSRTSHRDCPLNKRLEKAAIFSAHDSCCVDDQHTSYHSRPFTNRLEKASVHDSFDDDDDDDSQHTSHHDHVLTKTLEKPAIPSAHDSFGEDDDDNQHSSRLFDPSAHDSFEDDDYSQHSEDENEAGSDMEELSSDDEQLSCNCPKAYRGTHVRGCYLNPRNKGANLRSLPNEPTCSQSLVDESVSSFQPSGPLPSPEWKRRACEMVRHWSCVSVNSESEPVKAIKCAEILPHVRDSIIGDGHCLFRAISKELMGTERNHKAVRLAVTKFLTNSDNAKIFGQVFEGDKDPLSKVTSYTARLPNDAWGTDKEITVLATMFQVDILVFSQFGKQGRTWLKFTPAFSNHNCTIPSAGITLHLYHTPSRDHYDRVIPCVVD